MVCCCAASCACSCAACTCAASVAAMAATTMLMSHPAYTQSYHDDDCCHTGSDHDKSVKPEGRTALSDLEKQSLADRRKMAPPPPEPKLVDTGVKGIAGEVKVPEVPHKRWWKFW